MAILKTQAVVLKGWKLGETSKILALFTQDHGIIKVVAKGARDKNSKFKGCTEPLSFINIVYYDKRTRDLQLLSHADLVNPHYHIIGDIERTTLGLSAAELVFRASIGEETAPRIFQLLTEVLQALEKGDAFLEGYFWFFQNHFIDHLGFHPTWEQCFSCGKSLGQSGGRFYPQKGGLLCPHCGGEHGGFHVSCESLEVLYFMQCSDLKTMGSLNPSDQQKAEIRRVLDLYFRTHLEYLRPIRSLKLFYEMCE